MRGKETREKPWTGGPLRQLGGQAAVYGLGLAATNGLGFLLLPLISRYLSPAEFGIASVMTSAGGFLMIVFTLSLGSAALRHYRIYPSQQRRSYVGALFLFVSTFGLFLTALLIIFGRPISELVFGQMDYTRYWRIMVFSTFLQAGGVLPLAILRAREKPAAFLLYGLGSAVASRGAMAVLVVVWRHDALAYLLGLLLGNLLFYLIFLRFMLSESIYPDDLKTPLRRALSFSLPLVPHALSHWVLGVIDRIMLQRLMSAAAAGLYSAGNAVGMVMNLVIVQGINYAWVPYLYRLYHETPETADETASSLATHTTTIVTFFGLALVLASPEIIWVMVAPDYQAGRAVVTPTVMAYWAVALYHIPVSFLFLRERTRVLPFLTAIAAVANIAANLVLIPHLGMVGPAWAKVLAFSALAVMVTIAALKLSPFPFQWWRVGRICLAGIVIGTLGELAIRQKWPELYSVIARAGLLVGFAFLLVASRAYRLRDLLRVVRLAGRGALQRTP